MNYKIPDSHVSIEIYDADDGVRYRTTVSELELGEDVVQDRALSSRSLALMICNILRKAQKTPAPINDITGTVIIDIWNRENGNVTIEAKPSYKDLMKRLDSGWPISNAQKITMNILRYIANVNKLERRNERIIV